MEELNGLSAKPQDRQKILEMLAKEQQENLTVDSDDDEEPEDLSERLQGLDFDKDSQKIWDRLTEKEQEEFARMLKDGRLANLVDTWTPWWTNKPKRIVIEDSLRESSLPREYPKHMKDIPDISQLLKSSKPSADIKFSVINVLSAYVFITRLHNGNHHDCPVESAEELLSVAAVFKENQSFHGAQEAIQSVLQAIEKAGSAFSVHPGYPVVLLEDVLRLISPHFLEPVAAVISALSDISALLKKANQELKKGRISSDLANSTDSSDREIQRQIFHARKKVIFFISWVQRYGMCLSSLTTELSLELECKRAEMEEQRLLEVQIEQQRKSGKLNSYSVKPDIQEVR